MTEEDVNPALVNRRAEARLWGPFAYLMFCHALPPCAAQLYWPDNKLWYEITVVSVDMEAKTAKCASREMV